MGIYKCIVDIIYVMVNISCNVEEFVKVEFGRIDIISGLFFFRCIVSLWWGLIGI